MAIGKKILHDKYSRKCQIRITEFLYFRYFMHTALQQEIQNQIRNQKSIFHTHEIVKLLPFLEAYPGIIAYETE
jgi:hypothetical protein